MNYNFSLCNLFIKKCVGEYELPAYTCLVYIKFTIKMYSYTEGF